MSGVGDDLAAAAGDLEAAEEAKVDPLPDPGAGWHGHIKRRGNEHSIIAQQLHAQAFLLHINGALATCKETGEKIPQSIEAWGEGGRIVKRVDESS